MIIRPHHGMCLAFFEGKGYSPDFIRNMTDIISCVNEETMVRLKISADSICRACPNNREGSCASEEKVRQYDEMVLQSIGGKEGDEMSFLSFVRKVDREILLPGRREEICGDCSWNKICAGKAGRFHAENAGMGEDII